MPKKIAFVDDEDQILRALKRLFFGSEYVCLFFNNPKDLLTYLETESIDILITDIRMPEMDGIELMRHVKAIKPEVIRIALSGYTDSRQIMIALDSGLARLYIYKPWDNDDLKKLVDSLVGMIRKLRQSHLTQKINGLSSLPTFSKLYQNVVQLIEMDASVNQITLAIETDPAICAKLLRVANTAFYGSHTGSVQQAMMLLGLTNVRQIILTNAIIESATSIPYGEKLWQHAALTNKAVSSLYQLINKKNLPAHAGVVGLMHTIGLLYLATTYSSEYKKFIQNLEREQSIGNHLSFDRLENEIFGISHGEVGSFLLNWWELPFDIIEAAFYYRQPNLDEICNLELVAMVHLVSHCVLEQLDLELFQYPLNEALLSKANLTSAHKQAIDDFLITMLKKGEV